jgi:protein phosphatase PTC1
MLTGLQLWDVCSDQEAVDLVRNVADPQEASKRLVDYALGRFSTDNLSCMVVRFDGKALKRKKEGHSIGVVGDEETGRGISEADRIVEEARRSLEEGGPGAKEEAKEEGGVGKAEES